MIAWHPANFAHLIDLAQVCWNWLGFDTPVHPVLTFLAALLVSAVTVATVVYVRRPLAIAMVLYIACTLLDAGFKLDRPPETGPDIATWVDGRRLWIEAVAPGAGPGVAPGAGAALLRASGV